MSEANLIPLPLAIFGAAMNVVVVVEGPSHPLTVRRKDRRAGIWVNTDAVHVDAAPSFYAVATSASFDEAMSATDDLRHHVSIPQSIRLVGESDSTTDIAEFAEAVFVFVKEWVVFEIGSIIPV